MWDTLHPPSEQDAERYRAAGWWRDGTFLDDLARHAGERPDRPAVIGYLAGEREVSLGWADLAAAVERTAAALTALGVGRGDVVVVHLPNRWVLAALYLGCLRIGAVAAPVIPTLGGRELEFVLRAGRARVCVTVDTYAGVDYDRRLAEVAPETLAHRVVLGDAARTGAVDFGEFFVRTERAPAPGDPAGPDDPALLLYTSGTTGEMKGVVHSQNTLYAATLAVTRPHGLTGDDVVSVPNLLTHMAGATYAVLSPVALGATCVVADTNADMDLFLDLVERHGVTWAYLSPNYLMNLLAAQRDRPRDTSTVDRLVSGSAPVQPFLIAEVREVFGVPLHTLWGMTENGAVTVTRPDDPQGWGAHSDGRPYESMQLRIDADPGSETGHLFVRGASQCLGYLDRRELYESCLDADGWFDTGDLARPDGRGGIRITGRRSDLITRASGQKVSTLEVETVLMRHPAVADVVLVGYPDPDVPGAELVCAVVVPKGEPPTLEVLRSYLDGERMAKVLWPDRVQFVWELPRNTLGKVLRVPLRERLELAAAPRT
jgi:cyclohexanecarboxylate-CoA ligase